MRILQPIVITIIIVLSAFTLPAAAQTSLHQDRVSAVVFAYHRVGEDSYPDTSIRLEQFKSHIRELQSDSYNVMALPDIVEALKENKALPPRTVALTFDGGHSSILRMAVPLLLKNHIPFTLFVSADYADRKTAEYIRWSDFEKLARNKLVTVGLHPAAYSHLSNQSDEEISRQVNKARARYRAEMGEEPTLFAYPFGEYSRSYRKIVAQQKFEAAFGQQSGVAHGDSDIYALPRFTMTERYGGLDRFRLTANALPLPVSDIEPHDPHLKTSQPVIGFSVDNALAGNLEQLSCFASGQDKPSIERVGSNRVELRLNSPFEEERARINCTMPGPADKESEEPRWRWFGMLMTVPVPQNRDWNRAQEQQPED